MIKIIIYINILFYSIIGCCKEKEIVCNKINIQSCKNDSLFVCINNNNKHNVSIYKIRTKKYYKYANSTNTDSIYIVIISKEKRYTVKYATNRINDFYPPCVIIIQNYLELSNKFTGDSEYRLNLQKKFRELFEVMCIGDSSININDTNSVLFLYAFNKNAITAQYKVWSFK